MSRQDQPSARDPLPCPNCGTPLGGAYCAQCGEKADFDPVPVSAWLKRAWSSFAGLDIRLLHTLKHLLFSPGFLTNEHSQGRRIRYTKPLRLYIVISALAIAVMSLFGALSLESWTQGAEEPMSSFGIDSTDPDYRDRFDQRMNIVFPVVNLLSPLILCLVLKLLYRRHFMETHLVFSLHYFTFFVFVGLAPLPVIRFAGWATTVTLVLVFCAVTVYLAMAQKRVYAGPWRRHIPRLLVLMLAVVLISQALGLLTLIVTGATL